MRSSNVINPNQRQEHISDKAANARIRSCLRSMMANEPFFGSLALKMPMVESSKIFSIGADGRYIHYNPEWIGMAQSKQIKGALARIVTSCALKHHTRRNGRDVDLWQEATYYACEPILIDAGYFEGVSQYPDMSAEKIYDELYECSVESGDEGPGDGDGVSKSGPDADKDGSGETNDSEDTDEGQDAEENSGDSGELESEDKDEPQAPMDYEDITGRGIVLDSPSDVSNATAEQDWDENVAQSQSQANALGSKGVGNTAGSWKERLLGGSGTIEWPELLRRFMRENDKEDYTWSKPNRRFVDSGIYLPSMTSVSMGEMVFAIDTSGSVDTRALSRLWSEMRHAVMTVKPKAVTVIQCDRRVHSVERYTAYEMPEEIECYGRGGTSFRPVFREVDSMGIDIQCLIYFTDLEVRQEDYPNQPPSYPVLWAHYGDFIRYIMKHEMYGYLPKFGEMIEITDNY